MTNTNYTIQRNSNNTSLDNNYGGSPDRSFADPADEPNPAIQTQALEAISASTSSVQPSKRRAAIPPLFAPDMRKKQRFARYFDSTQASRRELVETISEIYERKLVGPFRGVGDVQIWQARKFLAAFRVASDLAERQQNINLFKKSIPSEVANQETLEAYICFALNDVLGRANLLLIQSLIETLPISAYLGLKNTVIQTLHLIYTKKESLFEEHLELLTQFFVNHPQTLNALDDAALLKIVELYPSKNSFLASSRVAKNAETILRNHWLSLQKNGLFKDALIFAQDGQIDMGFSPLISENPFSNLKTPWPQLVALSQGIDRPDRLEKALPKWFAGASIGLRQDSLRNGFILDFRREFLISKELVDAALEFFRQSDDDVYGIGDPILPAALIYLSYAYESVDDEREEVAECQKLIDLNVGLIARIIHQKSGLGFQVPSECPSIVDLFACEYLKTGDVNVLRALHMLNFEKLTIWIGDGEKDELSLDPTTLKRLRLLPRLTSLKMTFTEEEDQNGVQLESPYPPTPAMFEAIGRLEHLEELSIELVVLSEDYEDEWLAKLLPLQNLRTFTYHGQINSQALIEDYPRYLESESEESDEDESFYRNKDNDFAFNEAFPMLAQLNRVTIKEGRISSLTLVSLAQLSQMTYLDLTGSIIETTALEELLREHKKIAQLYLSGCHLDQKPLLITLADEVDGLEVIVLDKTFETETLHLNYLKSRRPNLRIFIQRERGTDLGTCMEWLTNGSPSRLDSQEETSNDSDLDQTKSEIHG